jgi:transcriptional regulator with XRE-family HTH domain
VAPNNAHNGTRLPGGVKKRPTSIGLKQHAVGDRVRDLRLNMGMSVRRLAASTGFSPSFISQVENGQASPSISSMEHIADALGVTLGEFFASATASEGDLIVRVAERQKLGSGWSHGHVESLSAMTEGRQLEPVLITLDHGGRSGKHPYAHSTEEFALVLGGKVTLTLGPEEHVLRRGDAVTLRPGELRLWENRAAAQARFLLVSSRFRLHQQGTKANARRNLAAHPSSLPRRKRPSERRERGHRR